MPSTHRHFGGYFFILLASIFWGSSVVLARVLLRHIPATALAHLTSIFAVAQLALLFLVTNRKFCRVSQGDLLRLAAIGTFGFAAGSLLINISITRTGPAM